MWKIHTNFNEGIFYELLGRLCGTFVDNIMSISGVTALYVELCCAAQRSDGWWITNWKQFESDGGGVRDVLYWTLSCGTEENQSSRAAVSLSRLATRTRLDATVTLAWAVCLRCRDDQPDKFRGLLFMRQHLNLSTFSLYGDFLFVFIYLE